MDIGPKGSRYNSSPKAQPKPESKRVLGTRRVIQAPKIIVKLIQFVKSICASVFSRKVSKRPVTDKLLLRADQYVKSKKKRLKQARRGYEEIPVCLSDGSKSKVFAYYSSNDAEFNINGKAKKNIDGKSTEVVSGDLALAYATEPGFATGDRKFQEIGTVEKLEKTDIVKIDGWEKVLRRKKEKLAIFDINQLGEVLRDMALPVWRGEESKPVNLLLTSKNHVMAFRITKKDGVLVFNFYDPNRTAVHKRFIISHPDQIIQLKVEHFLNFKLIEEYYEDGRVSALFSPLEGDENREERLYCCSDLESYNLSDYEQHKVLIADVMFNSIFINSPVLTRKIWWEFLESDLPFKVKSDFFSTFDHSILLSDLMQGDGEITRSLYECIFNTKKLSESEKSLLGKSLRVKDINPFTIMAIARNEAAFFSFIDFVLKSEMSMGDKRELLFFDRFRKILMQQNVFKILIDKVKRSENLSDSEKEGLLTFVSGIN